MNKKLVLFICALFLTGVVIFKFSQSPSSEVLSEVKEKAEIQQVPPASLPLNVADNASLVQTSLQGSAQCPAHVLSEKQLKLVYKTVKALSRQWQQRGVPEPVIDHVMKRAGLDVWLSRAMRQGYKMLKRQPPYAETEYPGASREQQRAASRLIMDGHLASYQQTVSENPDYGEAVYFINRNYAFLIEFVIASYVDGSEDIVSELIKSGVKVHTSDVFAAVRAGLSESIVEDMILAAGIAHDVVVQHNTQKRNLLAQAIVSQHPHLVNYLIRSGGQLDIDPFAPNALDLLGKYNSELSSEDVASLFELLTSELKHVNLASGLSNLQRLLGSDVVERAGIHVRGDTELSEDQLEQSAALKNELSDALTALSLYQDNCQEQLFSALSQLQLSTLEKRRERANKKPKRIDDEYIERNKAMAKLRRRYPTDTELLEVLQSDQSLMGKELLDDFRRKQLLKASEETLRDNPEIDAALTSALQEALRQQDFQTVTDLLTENIEDQQQILDTRLAVLLMSNPSVEEVQQLLDQGAKVDKSALFSVLRFENTGLAKILVDNGAEIAQNNGFMTPVMYAASITSNLVMLEWLLQNGGSIDNPSGGLDAIDHVLKNYTYKRKKSEPILRVLLQYQSDLKPSYIELAEKMKREQAKVYQQLVEKFPVFEVH